MGSHQNVILSNLSIVGQQESNSLPRKENIMEKKDEFIGVLEVFIHQARDIHNICIYHKQDVYAKIFLTSDPESTQSTRTINGGGQNPVFNENLKINVRTGYCSLRCEIWMLSRVKNYLEDQLLGFASVPLREIVKNQKLEQEFELSSSELFHSPSGFVKLSINYIGSPLDTSENPPVPDCLCNQETEERDEVSCELEKIEFPDPKVMNENEIMVSEYYSQTTENDDSLSSDSNDHLVSRIAEENLESSPRKGSKSSEKKEEKTGTEPDQKVVQQEIVNMYLKSMNQFKTEERDEVSCELEKIEFPDPKVMNENEIMVSEYYSQTTENDDSLSSDSNDHLVSRIAEENLESSPRKGSKSSEKKEEKTGTEPDQKVVQQEIVNMYLKSMNQFTEALAKMKLPIDKEPESNGKGPNPKVFYGSRAFF